MIKKLYLTRWIVMPIKYLEFDLYQSGTSPKPIGAGLFIYLKKGD